MLRRVGSPNADVMEATAAENRLGVSALDATAVDSTGGPGFPAVQVGFCRTVPATPQPGLSQRSSWKRPAIPLEMELFDVCLRS